MPTQMEPQTKTTPIIIGVHGQNGADGDSGIIVSPTAPENPKAGQLWQTASGEPIKRWDGSKWVIYYISVENLNVETLSAIAANLGTVTAGLIKSLDGHFFIQVNTGEVCSEDENGINSSAISKGVFVANGMDSGRHIQACLYSQRRLRSILTEPPFPTLLFLNGTVYLLKAPDHTK